MFATYMRIMAEEAAPYAADLIRELVELEEAYPEIAGRNRVETFLQHVQPRVAH